MPRPTPSVLRAAVAALLGLLAVAAGAPAAGAAALADPPCTIVWNGSQSGVWTLPDNWTVPDAAPGDPLRAPNSADSVCIGPSNNQPTVAGGVDVTALTVGEGGAAGLNVTGGGISATSGVAITATGSATVVGGITGGGLGLASGSSLSLGSGTVAVGVDVVAGATVTVIGATTFAEGITVSGTVNHNGGSAVVPSGKALTLNGGGTWAVGNDQLTVNGLLDLGGIQSGDARVGATGTLKYNGTAGSNVTVAGGGAVQGNVPAGSGVRVVGTPSVTGTWINAGTLVLDNATLAAPLTGLASTGTIQVDGTATVAVPFLNGGAITGASNLTVNGAVATATGSTMDGAVAVNGSLTYGGGASNVSLNGTLSGSVPANNRLVARDVSGPADAWKNEGTIAFAGSGGKLTADGRLTNLDQISIAGSGHQFNTPLTNQSGLSVGGGVVFSKGLLNSGTVTIGAAATVSGPLLQSGGSFAVNGTGGLSASGNLTVEGGTLANNGSVAVAGTTSLAGGAVTGTAIQASGPVEYTAGASTSSRVDRVGGSAAISGQMPSGHVLTVKAPTTVTGSFATSGTLDVAAAGSLSGGTAIVNGGAMTVAGTVSTPVISTDALTVTGDLNAPVASSGTFNVNAGGTVNLGGGTLTSSGPLVVRGTVSNGSASLTTNTTTLFSTGTLPDTTVALPARLRGQGDVGGLTNNGTVEPVDPANGTGATLHAAGYAQALTAELDAAPGAQVQVSGNATLNGTLNINDYTAPAGCGNAATYLTAGGTISGIWSTVTPSTFSGGRFFARPGSTNAGVRTIRVPSAPALSASGADGILQVGIGAPTFTGCDTITKYVATLTPAGGAPFERDVVNAAIGGLPNQVSYTVRLQAVNLAGAGAYSDPRTAKTNRSPTAVIDVSPAQPKPGEPVTLTASVSDDGTPAPALRWDADGNGSFNEGTQTITTFTYPKAGSYTAKLQLTDSDDVTTLVSRTVVVSSEPQPVPTPAPTPAPTAEPTTEPTVQPSPTPTPTLGPAQVDPADPKLDVRLAKAGLRASRSGIAAVALANQNAFPVTAKVTLRPRSSTATTAALASYGTRTATLKARRRAVVRVRLKKAARTQLRRKRTLKATLFVTLSGPQGPPVTVTKRFLLRAPRR